MIYRRFTEKSAEEWRQIYKALQLLEFLIKHGSERVIDDARGHITLLKMLRQFHYIDQNGKDQGINVRNRAKELTELLSDVERIRAERKKARATKNKYTGVEGGSGLGGGFSGSSGRYGGFGSESAGYGDDSYGGYSGGVYGDGGGFGGQSSEFGGTSGSRGERFEEYDEFDDNDRPAASAKAKRPERNAPPKKTEAPKKKAPEVDLFSFDDPEPPSSAAPAAAPSNGSGLGSLSGLADANDDDEFDDFQSATPAGQTTAPSNAFMTPLPPPISSAASSTAQFAAPKPVSAPQQANLSNMVSLSSVSPATSSATTPAAGMSSFAMASPASQSKPGGFQAPGYFNSGMASQPMQPSGVSSMASKKPATSTASKPAAASGDAFGALWNQASVGIKKASTPTSGGPTMGQLAKEKSSAGIWGASSSNPSRQPPPASGGGAMNDLLG